MNLEQTQEDILADDREDTRQCLGPNPKHQTAADLISKKVLKIVRDHSRHRVNVMLAALMEDFTAAIEKRKYPNA